MRRVWTASLFFDRDELLGDERDRDYWKDVRIRLQAQESRIDLLPQLTRLADRVRKLANTCAEISVAVAATSWALLRSRQIQAAGAYPDGTPAIAIVRGNSLSLVHFPADAMDLAKALGVEKSLASRPRISPPNAT